MLLQRGDDPRDEPLCHCLFARGRLQTAADRMAIGCQLSTLVSRLDSSVTLRLLLS